MSIRAFAFDGRLTSIALGGISRAGEKGVNLAVATAIAARDGGLQAPKHVLAVYPIAQADTTTPSYNANANAKPLNRAMMGWFARHTTRSSADLLDPRISLVKANLQNLPPVTIVTAQIDPLLSDGEMLEAAIRQAGGQVERRHYNGVAHEFFGMGAVVKQAADAQEYAGGRLKASLGN